jgi:hypothetical protein
MAFSHSYLLRIIQGSIVLRSFVRTVHVLECEIEKERLQQKTVLFFECFPCVRPEPVLAK